MTGIKDWTDRDYAEAALDMLPESVEEIAEFLRTAKIHKKPKCSVFNCPIAQWMSRWADGGIAVSSAYAHNSYATWMLTLPIPVREFIWRFDSGMIDL